MIDMKFDMCFKNIERSCNSMVRFSNYVAMLICLVRFVALRYNLVKGPIRVMHEIPSRFILSLLSLQS